MTRITDVWRFLQKATTASYDVAKYLGIALMLNSVALSEKAAAALPAVRFHGVLRVVECNVNDGHLQTVNFGDAVGIHKIDGKRYLQTVPFSVKCVNSGGGKIPDLTLTLEGTKTSFDNAAVETDVSGLGVQIKVNGKAQTLNKAVRFSVSSTPSLSAVLVKDPKIELEAKPFTATIRLRVDVA